MSVIFPLLMYCCINLSSSKSFINKTMSVQDFQPISSWKEQGEAAGFTLPEESLPPHPAAGYLFSHARGRSMKDDVARESP